MNFWPNGFEYFKERRYASVFFGTLAVFAGVLIAGSIFYQIADNANLLQYWPFMLVILGLLTLAFIWRGVRQWRAWQTNRYKSSPLSRDERHKARSKLCNNINPVKSKAPRAPDIDLKY